MLQLDSLVVFNGACTVVRSTDPFSRWFLHAARWKLGNLASIEPPNVPYFPRQNLAPENLKHGHVDNHTVTDTIQHRRTDNVE